VAARADELGLEADRRAVGDDLEIVIGQARQQGAAGHLGDMGDRSVESGLLAQRAAEEANRGIVDALGEIEQHAVRAEVHDVVRIEILDRRIGAAVEQRDPVVVGAHVHAALVGADRQRAIVYGFVRRLALRVRVERVVDAARHVHAKCSTRGGTPPSFVEPLVHAVW